MHRKYMLVIGRPGPKIQCWGPAEHLSAVSQFETWLVWPCKGNKRSLVPTAHTWTAVPGRGRHCNSNVSAWHTSGWNWGRPNSPSSIAGHSQKGCDWCSPVLLRMPLGKTTVACPTAGRCSRTQEYQSGHPVKLSVVFLLEEAYSNIWGK